MLKVVILPRVQCWHSCLDYQAFYVLRGKAWIRSRIEMRFLIRTPVSLSSTDWSNRKSTICLSVFRLRLIHETYRYYVYRIWGCESPMPRLLKSRKICTSTWLLISKQECSDHPCPGEFLDLPFVSSLWNSPSLQCVELAARTGNATSWQIVAIVS